MSIRRQTFRLYPNREQELKLFEARRLHVYLYNACISHRQFEFKNGNRSVDYFTQQNLLSSFKDCWPEFKQLGSQALQATVKRVDFAFNRFFEKLGGYPRFKSIKKASGFTYPAKSGWTLDTTGKNGTLSIKGLGIKSLKMRGKAKEWGNPTTLTIVFKPGLRQWFASITVKVKDVEPLYGSQSDLDYASVVAYDLGTATAITTFDAENFTEIENPRLTRKNDERVRKIAKSKRRKRSPKKGVKPSRRWLKFNKIESKLKSKVARQRKDWQHKVTSDIASRYDIGVTEKLNTKAMTKKPKSGNKRKRQKSGLNREILSVGFGTINKMISYKIHAKGGIIIEINTRKVKPSQRCPDCGTVHKKWAELSNRFHECECGFSGGRDKASAMVMLNVALGKQVGLGTNLSDSLRWLSSTSVNSKRKDTGSLKQLSQMKRQKLESISGIGIDTLSAMR
jgi:putative transposase